MKNYFKFKPGSYSFFILIAAFLLTFTSCEKEDLLVNEPETSQLKRGSRAPAPADQSIAEIAIGAGFSELVGALAYVDEEQDAGLVDLFLNGTDQYTVFAPTNDAFEALYEALEIDEITDLPAELVLDVLFYHVTEGRRAANSVVPKKGKRTIKTLLEKTFDVKPDLSIEAIGNTANIAAADISASNGIIHVIDAVILPFVVGDNEGSAADLKRARVNGNMPVGPPENPMEAGAPAPGDNSIAEIAIAAEFDELVGALTYVDEELDAGLVDLFLNGTDQYTVFAPTNEAFEGLYEALKIDGIIDLPAELVQDVLLYHVTEGRRAANSVVPPVKDRVIKTLLGVTFSVNKNGKITAIGNTANIITADISASNGIIHVIDAVILPIE